MKIYVSREMPTRLVGDLRRTVVLVGAIGVLLALFAGIWLWRRLSRPLERLAEASMAVAAGSRDAFVPELKGRDEVASLTRTFNMMTVDLRESEERLRQSERVAAWREIARRIAHEIKNPLFPIQMSIETLKKAYDRKHPDLDEFFEESTETVLEEVARMKRIVTEFSDFARMPAPRPERLDLAEMAGDVLAFHRDTAPEVQQRLVGSESLFAEVDHDQMRQVLTNLVQNAQDALKGDLPNAPVLEVRVEPAGDDALRVVVTDNGPGMSKDTLARLFTPYFTTKSAGTGLGLAIVHRIVAEHNGTVSVDSEPGVGTRFVVQLPRTQASVDHQAVGMNNPVT